MTKTVSTSKKPRKQHSPEFRSEALKLAERIGVTAAARELSLYESQLYNWRSKQQNQQTSSERELEMSTEIARLKRQLAERDEELAILQKAATYFISGASRSMSRPFGEWPVPLPASPGIELGFIKTEFTGCGSNTDAFSKLQGFTAKFRRMLFTGFFTG